MKRILTIKFLGMALMLAVFIAASTGCASMNQLLSGGGGGSCAGSS